MKKTLPAVCIFSFWFLIFGFLSGCGPTYPKERVQQAIIDLCRKEYKLGVDSKISGNTVAVYLPADNLFDALLSLDSSASKKINDVIMGVSRVALSTDANFDFYIVIAQDPKVPEIEIVYIRYVGDVKKFLWGGISRDEYAKRAVIMIKTPPQAERERILKDLFAKLNVEKPEELVKEYMYTEIDVTGIGEVSYWNKNFFIKNIEFTEFLASQIGERIKIEFKQDKDINRLYELKNSEGIFVSKPPKGFFAFKVNISDRVAPLYLDSGMEWGAQKKRLSVLKKLFNIVGDILWSYKFEDFDEVEFTLPMGKKMITKEKLWGFTKGKISIEDII